MPRLTRIYTRHGDDGSTALGTGERVMKDDPQVEAYGTVDELNAAIGIALALGACPPVAEELTRIQSELFNLGGDLCLLGGTPAAGAHSCLIGPDHVQRLERSCDRLNEDLGSLDNFILPTGTKLAAALHLARTICRRAERRVISLDRQQEVSAEAIRYLNRLSDLLFIMARYENHSAGIPDVLWDRCV
ncbi:MAG: cob(I)yrinic acid a,c-diamide adenosyltransferase [Acidobacteriota bacterium]|nr:MAG: cob(I)yrinic acid a,c-diamide adenosyltransferase [Acidobacteriota bacterium]